MYRFEDYIKDKTDNNETVGGPFTVLTLYGLYLEWLGQQGKMLSQFQRENVEQHFVATTASELLFQLQIINAYQMKHLEEAHKNTDNFKFPLFSDIALYDNKASLAQSISQVKDHYYKQADLNVKAAQSRQKMYLVAFLMTAVTILSTVIALINEALFLVLIMLLPAFVLLSGKAELRRTAAYEVEKSKAHVDNMSTIKPVQVENQPDNGYQACVDVTKECMLLTWNNVYTKGMPVEQEVNFNVVNLANRLSLKLK